MAEKLEFHFKGGIADGQQLPVDCMINLLSNIKELVYLIVSQSQGIAYNERFKPSKEIKDNYLVKCEVPQVGSYAMPIEIDYVGQELPLDPVKPGEKIQQVMKWVIDDEEEKIEYLNIIIDESERLNILSNNILLMSRLENRTEAVTKSDFNLTEQMRQTVAVLYFKWSEKNIDIVIEGDDVYVSANRELTAQMWINLIDNAIKFTPEGGSITITTDCEDKKVKVSVLNSGEGISEADLRHIWERFYKSDKSRGMDKKGVGLGLHIVKTIISQHGGEVFAESKEGEFAKFTFACLSFGDRSIVLVYVNG